MGALSVTAAGVTNLLVVKDARCCDKTFDLRFVICSLLKTPQTVTKRSRGAQVFGSDWADM